MRDLNASEIRVLGALIEKKLTTPDQYPLSLNALVNACNQKSNRDPVLDLSEQEVQSTLDELCALNLVVRVTFGTRVAKYQHRFCNTEFSRLHLTPPELAIVCCLFLRGPQTPGELRTRTQRLHEFSNVEQVEASLKELQEDRDSPLLKKLDREPGRRESRFMHLFGGEREGEEALSTSSQGNVVSGLNSKVDIPTMNMDVPPVNTERIANLEAQIKLMQEDIDLLKKQWAELNS